VPILSTFMTAGSYSVMLVCPTRRIFCCQGHSQLVPGRQAPGSETTSTPDPSVSKVAACAANEAGTASRPFNAEVSGMTPVSL